MDELRLNYQRLFGESTHSFYQDDQDDQLTRYIEFGCGVMCDIQEKILRLIHGREEA